MIISIHCRDLEQLDQVKEHTTEKLRLVLNRFNHRITRVDVYISDENGPKGGEDILCKMELKLNGHNSFVIQERSDNCYEAINACCHRAKRTVGRTLERFEVKRKSRRHVA